jgi:hypothetical protein
MKVAALPDHNKPWNLPHCEATVGKVTQYYRARMGQSDQCLLKAHYEIDGKLYCERHAGQLLLDYAIKQGEI